MWPFRSTTKSATEKESLKAKIDKDETEWEYCGSDDEEDNDEYEYGYITVSEDEEDGDDHNGDNESDKDAEKDENHNGSSNTTPSKMSVSDNQQQREVPRETIPSSDEDDDDDDDDVVDQLLAITDPKRIPKTNGHSTDMAPTSMEIKREEKEMKTVEQQQQQQEEESPETEIPLTESESVTSAGTCDEITAPQQRQPVVVPSEEKRQDVNESFASEEGGKSTHTEDSALLDVDVEDSEDENDESYSDEELEGEDDDELIDDEESEEEEEEEEEEEDDDDEGPTSLAEKQSLLALAAEHDRVDILKAILAESTSTQEREQLLHQVGVPPLHVSVSYGSTHATSCLLRMGANPAIRPSLQDIQQQNDAAATAAEQKQQQQLGAGGSPVRPTTRSMAHLQKYVGVTAWELAFGIGTTHSEDETSNRSTMEQQVDTADNHNDNESTSTSKGSWFGGMFGGGSSTTATSATTQQQEEMSVPIGEKSNDSNGQEQQQQYPPPTFKPVDMAPSKREGIRHAFTAEALRCIGADEVTRLQQLLESGMPSTIDVGGKTLHGWCVEMGAPQCEELIRPVPKEEETPDKEHDKQNTQIVTDTDEQHVKEENTKEMSTPPQPPARIASARTLHDGTETLASLTNRQEELESLASALSSVLDNLAEEVSVCHGLLLLGGGASALASHVRSLKDLQERRRQELSKAVEEWEYSQDELAYCVRELKSVATPTMEDLELLSASQLPSSSSFSAGRRSKSRTTTAAATDKNVSETKEEEDAQRRQLVAQLAASENKVRKLRASITDLSEENTRDLAEVEKRGLSGGIKLVRTLREEIRELEFKLSEIKNEEATCRAKMNLIRSRLETEQQKKKKQQQQQQASAVANEKIALEAEDDDHKQNTTEISSTNNGESSSVTNSNTNDEQDVSKTTPEAVANEMKSEATAAVKASTQSSPEAGTSKSSMEREIRINDNEMNGIDESPHHKEDSSLSSPPSPSPQEPSAKQPTSETISTGHSTEIALRHPGGRGYTPMILWDIFVRIIGLGRAAVKRSADNLRGNASSVMIV